MSTFPEMVKIYPKPCAHGLAKTDHYSVTPMQSAISSLHPGEYCPEGTYVRLLVDGRLWMSDTLSEHRTNWRVVREARGNVLIAGLGLGMIFHPILAKKEVTAVTVIEKYADVISLVGPSVRHKKLTIVEGDIYQWRPAKGTKFDCIYFDIWSEQSTDCLEEMKELHLAFRSFKAKGGWMDSWRRDELKAHKRQREREDRRWGRYR